MRVLNEKYSIKVNPTIDVELRLEVTNVGEKPTSLEPEIVVRALTPDRVFTSFALPIQEPNRELPPHAQKYFIAKATVGAVYPFCWFKRYNFRVLKGRGAIIRYRNAMHNEMRFGRYWCEYFLFRWFGQLIKAI